MDKEHNPENNPSLLLPNNKEEYPKKTFGGGGGGSGSNDRLKRDEWSEGAVSSLLETYESKWALRNRAKLKGHDWEEVARYVSARANNTKSPKTQTQCKNKIESMKKRYRSESTNADGSSWLLYPRLDRLLRGSAAATPRPQQLHLSTQVVNPPLLLLETSQVVTAQPIPPTAIPPLPAPPAPPLTGTPQNSHGSNGEVDHRMDKVSLYISIAFSLINCLILFLQNI